MVKMSKDLLDEYLDEINFTNADYMFESMEQIIAFYGMDFIIREDHPTKEDCVRSYMARCAAMKSACEAIEHYIKALLIQNHTSWDAAASLGHNLLRLFNSLDDDSRYSIIMSLLVSTNTDTIKDFFDPTHYNNTDYSHYIEEFFTKIIKEKMIDIENPMDDQAPTDIQDISEERVNNSNEIPNSIQNTRDVINDATMRRTVEDELEILSPPIEPGKPRKPLFSIATRFPGQSLVEGNAEFLISLARALNSLSKKARTEIKIK